MKKWNFSKIIEMKMSDLDRLRRQLAISTFPDQDKELFSLLIDSSIWLHEALAEKDMTINKLRRAFGATTEKKSKIKGNNKEKNTDKSSTGAEENTTSAAEASPESSTTGIDAEPPQAEQATENNLQTPIAQPKPEDVVNKGKNNGRNSVDLYTNAEEINIPFADLYPGINCLDDSCDGKLYKFKDLVLLRLTGEGLVISKKYIVQRLRCNICNTIYTPQLPADAKKDKYDYQFKAQLCVLKYYLGLPLYRMERLQSFSGAPLPDSTQWDLIYQTKEATDPVYEAVEKEAAQAKLTIIDDTTNRILDLIRENETQDPKRKGIFTSCILAETNEHKIALFYTGRNYAGENVSELLTNREKEAGQLIQMSDALETRNIPKLPEDLMAKLIICFCLTHGRRKFVELMQFYPKICLNIVVEIAKVYKNEKFCKEHKLDDVARLKYHQEHSSAIMARLYFYLQAQLLKKRVEPNSNIGKAIKYMLRHWVRLTEFLRTPGAPIDSNEVEQALKIAIRHRKNSLFYKSTNSAQVGDRLMSLIYTCEFNGINPFEYLTVLQENLEKVKGEPKLWLPWNYKSNFFQLRAAA